MGIGKPYCRLWRPVKGYESLSLNWQEDQPVASIDYLDDNRFVGQAEMESLVTTAHLIIRDLYEVFNYIEPCDSNQHVYSHRIYELFLRTATEFESNCKGILRDNNYAKAEKDMNILDYYKIAPAVKLLDYMVSFERWGTRRMFMPFAGWNQTAQAPLTWYQEYNHVKHNRYSNFSKANLENLMNAVAGLLCILHAQIGENMDRACFEGNGVTQSSQDEVVTNTFTIKAPTFTDAEQYEFIWDDIKGNPDAVQKYIF